MVVTAPAGVEEGGSKVVGEIVAVLYRDDVRALRAMPGVWPPEFVVEEGGEEARPALAQPSGSGSSDDSDLPPLAANPNRRRPTYETSSSEEEEGGGGVEEGGGEGSA